MTQYQVVKKDGSFLTMVQDGTINTAATSITLFGHDFIDYGNYLNENLVYLTENFANVVAPPNQLVGQLWYNLEQASLNYYDISNQWRTIITSAGATFYGDIVVSNGTDMVELLTNGTIILSNPNGPSINFQYNIGGPTIADLYISNANNTTTLHSSVPFISDQTLYATQNLYTGGTLVIDNVANLYCQNNQLYCSVPVNINGALVANSSITSTDQYNFSTTNSSISSGLNGKSDIDFFIGGNNQPSYTFTQNGQISITSTNVNPASIIMTNPSGMTSIDQYAPNGNADAINVVAVDGLYVNGTLTASLPYVQSEISNLQNFIAGNYLPLTGGYLSGNLGVTNSINLYNTKNGSISSTIYTDINGINGGNDLVIETGPNQNYFAFLSNGQLVLPQQASQPNTAPQWGQVQNWANSTFKTVVSPGDYSRYLMITESTSTLTISDGVYSIYVRLWGAGGGGGGGGGSSHGAWGGAGGGGGGMAEFWLQVSPGQQYNITIGTGGAGGGNGASGGSSSFGGIVTCGGGGGGGAGGDGTYSGTGGGVWIASGTAGFGLITNASGSTGCESYHDNATGNIGGGWNGGVAGTPDVAAGNGGWGSGGGGSVGAGATGGNGLCIVMF